MKIKFDKFHMKYLDFSFLQDDSYIPLRIIFIIIHDKIEYCHLRIRNCLKEIQKNPDDIVLVARYFAELDQARFIRFLIQHALVENSGMIDDNFVNQLLEDMGAKIKDIKAKIEKETDRFQLEININVLDEAIYIRNKFKEIFVGNNGK